MSKNLVLLIAIFFASFILGANRALSASIIKPTHAAQLMKYNRGKEFITLTFKQFASITGERKNLLNRISFGLMKVKVKHDLKKNPELIITEFYRPGERTPVWKIVLWVL